MAKRKKSANDAQLNADAQAAKAAGMTYGQYKTQQYIEEQKKSWKGGKKDDRAEES